MKYLKKIPWWGWAVFFVAIFIFWQFLSGWGETGKLYNIILDNLRTDQSRIIQLKNEWIKDCEEEIAKLEKEKERLQKEKATIQRQASESATEIAKLKRRINELQIQLQNIVTPRS